jgi:hypothetical protein
MLVFCTLIYLLIFAGIIYKSEIFAIEGLSKRAIVFLFLIKVAAGFLMMTVYAHYYKSGDMYTFFAHGEKLFNLFWNDTSDFFKLINSGPRQIDYFLWENPFQRDSFAGSRIMVFTNFFIRFFSFGCFSVHTVFFSFFSFFGLVLIAKGFTNKISHKQKFVLFSLFLIPSVLIWTSGIQKESLAVLLIGTLLFYSNFLESIPKKLSGKINFCLAFFLLFALKNYVAVALFIVILANSLSHLLKIKKQMFSVLTIFVFLLCTSVFLQKAFHTNVLEKITERRALAISEAKGGVFLYSNKHFISVDYRQKNKVLILQPDSTFTIKSGSNYLQWEQNNMADTTFVKESKDNSTKFHFLYEIEPANSAIAMNKIKPDILSVLKQIPESLAINFFYPTIFQIYKPAYAQAVIENILIFLFILIAVFNADTQQINKKRLINVLVYSLLVLIIIGLTNNVIGSVVRYKTVVWLILVPELITILDIEKLKKRLRFFIQTKRH